MERVAADALSRSVTPDDQRVRAYFDARAHLLDRVYERGPGLRGAFEAWLYAPLRRRLELTLAELGDLSGQRVLDVGCGPGRYAVAAAEQGAEVVAIDISPTMLMLARASARDRSVGDACRFVQADFAAFEPDGDFDVALMIGVLEYLPELRSPLARLHALTRRRVIVSVPPRFGWRTTARRVRHGLRSGPPSFHPHSPVAVTSCLEGAGFASCRVNQGWIVAYH